MLTPLLLRNQVEEEAKTEARKVAEEMVVDNEEVANAVHLVR